MKDSLIGKILNSSLYVRIKLTEEEVKEYNRFNKDTVRSYCPFCEEISVFKINRRFYQVGRKTDQYIFELPETDDDGFPASSFTSSQYRTQPTKISDNSNVIVLSCSLDESHQITIFLQIVDNSIIKVGQYPSYSDLQRDKKSLYSELPESDAREMIRATGLFSHGIGVGSFVYLRRIFENIIIRSYDEIDSPDIDRDTFLKRRMEDRIDYLKEQLPSTVVRQRKVFSILSKGIHEMEEEECLKYFPIIKESIESMLQEHLNKKMTEKRNEKVTKEINKLHQNLKDES